MSLGWLWKQSAETVLDLSLCSNDWWLIIDQDITDAVETNCNLSVAMVIRPAEHKVRECGLEQEMIISDLNMQAAV